MMKYEQVKDRAKTANKVVLEVEKEKDATEKAVDELKRQLQPKSARTDDDAGDAHDLLAEWHYAKRPFICWCKACSCVRG